MKVILQGQQDIKLKEQIENAQNTANSAKTTAEAALPLSGGTMTGPIELPVYGLRGGAGTKEVFLDMANNLPYIGFHENYNSGSPIILNGIATPIRASDAVNKIYVDSSVVGQNLLDNWYFENPINQRGKIEYPNSASYTIDRWYAESTSTIVIENGLKITGGLTQRNNTIPTKLIGENFTLSIMVNGNVYSHTQPLTVDNWTQFSFGVSNVKGRFLYGSTDKVYFISIFSESENDVFQACKFEHGSVQTLARQENGIWVLKEIPDYTTELLKCQYYYQNLNVYFGDSTNYPQHGKTMLTKIQTMRIKPTVNFTITRSQNVNYPSIVAYNEDFISTYVNPDNEGDFSIEANVKLSAEL